eukprot:TRINITY_DN2481_c0_g1_i2.p1 TRINITY_DN2481_c0_g1~~TRINITY_DN2481_c0_g1_i2.p1  ORF type:complete len:391 (-),score=83.63 TRINITY_DN2481_c0_g1_i2:50-1222(-)
MLWLLHKAYRQDYDILIHARIIRGRHEATWRMFPLLCLVRLLQDLFFALCLVVVLVTMFEIKPCFHALVAAAQGISANPLRKATHGGSGRYEEMLRETQWHARQGLLDWGCLLLSLKQKITSNGFLQTLFRSVVVTPLKFIGRLLKVAGKRAGKIAVRLGKKIAVFAKRFYKRALRRIFKRMKRFLRRRGRRLSRVLRRLGRRLRRVFRLPEMELRIRVSSLPKLPTLPVPIAATLGGLVLLVTAPWRLKAMAGDVRQAATARDARVFIRQHVAAALIDLPVGIATSLLVALAPWRLVWLIQQIRSEQPTQQQRIKLQLAAVGEAILDVLCLVVVLLIVLTVYRLPALVKALRQRKDVDERWRDAVFRTLAECTSNCRMFLFPSIVVRSC